MQDESKTLETNMSRFHLTLAAAMFTLALAVVTTTDASAQEADEAACTVPADYEVASPDNPSGHVSFAKACRTHAACTAEPGADRDQCDGAFYLSMLDSCWDELFWITPEARQCTDAALAYYETVAPPSKRRGYVARADTLVASR